MDEFRSWCGQIASRSDASSVSSPRTPILVDYPEAPGCRGPWPTLRHRAARGPIRGPGAGLCRPGRTWGAPWRPDRKELPRGDRIIRGRDPGCPDGPRGASSRRCEGIEEAHSPGWHVAVTGVRPLPIACRNGSSCHDLVSGGWSFAALACGAGGVSVPPLSTETGLRVR